MRLFICLLNFKLLSLYLLIIVMLYNLSDEYIEYFYGFIEPVYRRHLYYDDIIILDKYVRKGILLYDSIGSYYILSELYLDVVRYRYNRISNL